MDFYRRMHMVCMAIPEGRVASYGQIALLCGVPGHARQVGYGLKWNLAGRDAPAHRVVNGRGELSGASRFEFHDLQKNLLVGEGVDVSWNGRSWCVDMKQFGWKTTMADMERFEQLFNMEKI